MSADQRDKSCKDNLNNTIELTSFLKQSKFLFHPGEGRFDGIDEDSFMIKVKCENDLKILLDKAGEYGQECILVCDGDGGNPELVGSKGIFSQKGEVTTSEKRPEGNFTKIEETFYFIQ